MDIIQFIKDNANNANFFSERDLFLLRLKKSSDYNLITVSKMIDDLNNFEAKTELEKVSIDSVIYQLNNFALELKKEQYPPYQTLDSFRFHLIYK